MKSYNQDYNLYIGYMPYSRMDRVKEQGTAFSLEIMANIINNLSKYEIELQYEHWCTSKYLCERNFLFSLSVYIRV